MKIRNISSSTYSVIPNGNVDYMLVKVLGHYDSKDDAISDIVDILLEKKTEWEVEEKRIDDLYQLYEEEQ
ncbi:MAG: hypothetical protein H0Z32_11765 [Bacillaceae bacterium]|nr:hypothetical protein [Bacillaceae bacterium]